MNIRPTLLLAGLLLAGGAGADEAPAAEDLYLKAMQSIADGRQADASEILARMVAQGPRHAGEWLDLALIQCALGHDAEAEALFRDIETRFMPPQGIRDIIAQQRAAGCYRWRALSQWGVSAARGHDSNVNQGASVPSYTDANGLPIELLPEYRPHADRYSVLTGDFLRDLSADGDLGFVQLHLRQYDRMSAYNSYSAFAGAEHPWRLARWRLRSSALVGMLSLGGRLYQEQAQVQLRASPPLALPAGLELSLLASLSYTSYKTLSNFDAGTAELRGMLGYHDEHSQAQLALGLQSDRGAALRPGGDRAGWSARLYGRRLLGGQLQGELDWTLQRWRGERAYSPGVLELARRQSNQVLRATLVYPLRRDHALHLEWRAVRNGENIEIFRYHGQQVQLSWHWSGL
ncbi:tetratricopeptide repeat protein [Rugamonas sp. DEMB1]|uniref:tetratricopeptide repeat protein n=1 Tax=Rugamonas sp. DEMB1 TaxID=3039386 RepID=UPI00244D1596|nr:tetratricopeptide repeat protein [Rugamonas sp. DEMB1]WGG51380.1 tetratricopeptide repeat protein [Rugamonas sp. DEMB1]